MTVQLAPDARPRARPAPSEDIYHPIFRLGELLELTSDRLDEDGASVLDAYLAVASICQVLADHAHRDHGDLRRIRKYASRLPQPAGAVAAAGLGVAANGLGTAAGARDGGLLRRLDGMEQFSSKLAEAIWGLDGPSTAELRAEWNSIASPDGLPLRSVAIPPRCFFTFDQRPEDCVELAIRFAETRRDRSRPALVVGVRTSGCFLAPIVTAGLRRAGYADVEWISWRPGQPTLARDRRIAGRAASEGAEVLIVDDPPTSGGSLARTAAELAALGVDRSSITLLLPLFPDSRQWLHRLAEWQQVRLEWQDWAIHALLAEHMVRDVLSSMTGWRIEDAARVTGDVGTRRHVRARYRVRIETSDERLTTRHVVATGVGLGVFGEAAAAVAQRLEDLVPTVHGVRDGLMYRDWLPDESSIDESDPARRNFLARGIARYAFRRADALPVDEDIAKEMSGHDALWEQAARWLGAGYGRLALPLRPLLHAAGRKLTRTAHASLIDSNMGRGQWFDAGNQVIKADFAEATYVYQLPMTYDAAYDAAAAAAARMPDRDFGSLVRTEFEAASGNRISDARWFLYQHLSLLDHRDSILRTIDASAESRARLVDLVTDGERAAASLHRAFVAMRFLHDQKTPVSGDLVAIDVDGVLEGGPWWYAAPSAPSLVALRALLQHGYRPVLATGRSIGEAVDRCRDYRLAGAVAEYGCAIHDAASGASKALLGPDETEDMQSLRLALARLVGVALDPAFRHAIRAFAVSGGRRVALPLDAAMGAVAACGLDERVRIEQGWAQTDFVPIDIDKRTGLQALISDLGVEGDPPLALAVGDSAPDLAMFRLARLKAVPANANPGLEKGSAAMRCRGAFGAGLAEAVGVLIGHRPGQCVDCAVPDPRDADSQLLFTLLGAADRRGAPKLRGAVSAWRLLGRS